MEQLSHREVQIQKCKNFNLYFRFFTPPPPHPQAPKCALGICTLRVIIHCEQITLTRLFMHSITPSHDWTKTVTWHTLLEDNTIGVIFAETLMEPWSCLRLRVVTPWGFRCLCWMARFLFCLSGVVKILSLYGIILTDCGRLHLSHSYQTPHTGTADSLLHSDQRITKLQTFFFTGKVWDCVKAQLFSGSAGGFRVSGTTTLFTAPLTTWEEDWRQFWYSK